MLLLVVRGATSFKQVRTFDGVCHSTFKGACQARGLLGDDQEWYNAFDEAASWATSRQLRKLFVTMLLFCEVGDEHAFFEKVWKSLADDIQYQFRDMIGNQEYQMADDDLRDRLLDDLTTLFARSGGNIRNFNLPQRSAGSASSSTNRLIEEELSYDMPCSSDQSNFLSSLNDEQIAAFNSIIQRVTNHEPGFFFVSRYGGTGKTYLWNCIVTYLRSQKKIVLTVASSGVASLLLPGGRTAHSRFKIPCDLDEASVSDIKRGSMLAELIQMTSLVI